jgi:hypothetical protein
MPGTKQQTGTRISSMRGIVRKATSFYREPNSGNINKTVKTDRLHNEIG